MRLTCHLHRDTACEVQVRLVWPRLSSLGIHVLLRVLMTTADPATTTTNTTTPVTTTTAGAAADNPGTTTTTTTTNVPSKLRGRAVHKITPRSSF